MVNIHQIEKVYQKFWATKNINELLEQCTSEIPAYYFFIYLNPQIATTQVINTNIIKLALYKQANGKGKPDSLSLREANPNTHQFLCLH